MHERIVSDGLYCVLQVGRNRHGWKDVLGTGGMGLDAERTATKASLSLSFALSEG
jgi:hypothetical protein